MITLQIPRGSLVREPSARFLATYSIATGLYEFTAALNTDKLLIRTATNNAYVIALMSFYVATDAGIWLTALQDSTTLPQLRFRFKNSPTATFLPEPIIMANYRQAEDRVIYFVPRSKDDQLLCTLSGNFGQPLPLVGEPTLAAQANFTVYQISDPEWIEKHPYPVQAP